jgi:predicted regulator of Ras-like GTPase activity (Roadblock/LC7/MglB family)
MSNRPGEKVKPADSYIVRLSALAESWSEQLRQEIVRPSLHDAQVALPGEIVDAGVKQGRLACSWRMLRSWISPAPLPAASAQDQVVLELPLNLLAPMFLARKSQSGAARKKVILDERIPNLFFAVPQADQQQAAQAEPGKPKSPAPGEPTGPVTAQPQKPNHFARESALATGSPLPTPGRATQPQNLSPAAAPEVGAPVAAKPATPNEIVSRAAALDGVAGALIALQDGLLVASHVSPELNPETLAAFIPRIFAKLGECAGDLRLGQLNRLEFTVGDVPWRILRLNSILFASFGQAGKSLPSQQLDELAAELTRKPK